MPNELNYEQLGVTPPTSQPHGTDDDIRKNLTPPKVTKWFQRGNELVGETDIGEIVSMLPTDIMLTGVDENNLPIFKKL
jgi:hypothetical protein